jgi:hypothetical protein
MFLRKNLWQFSNFADRSGSSRGSRQMIGQDSEHGTGRSHRAIEMLPQLAVYVTSGRPDYFYDITRKIGRADITLVNCHSFCDWCRMNVGRTFSAIYFDHAVQDIVNPAAWQKMMGCLDRVRPYLRAAAK